MVTIKGENQNIIRDSKGRFVKGTITNQKDLPIEEIKRLYCKNHINSKEIARIFNCSQWCIYEKLKKGGVKINHSKRRILLIKIGKISKPNWKLRANKTGQAWNKNLTKEIEERVNKISKQMKGRKCLWVSDRMKLNNPMKNPETIKKMVANKNYEESSKKVGETLKRLHKEKKIRTNSEIMKRKYSSGELISPMKGKKHNEETRIKIAQSKKGKKLSEETKKKISQTLKGRKFSSKTIDIFKERRKHQICPLKDTSIEIKIQNFLKLLGIEFFTHQYLKDIEHSYQCDILIPSMNLVIECDGNYWHKFPIGKEIDHIRTSELLQKGFKVLRLWESEIKKIDLNKFQEKINNLK